ncbi:MAG: ImmA/IrrE family metallo-endopeptidase [Pseudomonadales bacterium]
MKPAAAAIQLTRVWRQVCPNEDPYPVDCRMLAKALNIKVHGEPIDDNFEAQLRIREVKGVKRKAIIYNENIREEGRKNFCISHEIGHSSCHADQEEFFCSSKDLNDMALHPKNLEQEANLFAATLLMPADDFRARLENLPPTLATISRLADERYNTSLTATCTRLLDLSPTAHYGMAIVRGNNTVVRWAISKEMCWTGFGFRKGHQISAAGLAHNPEGERVESDVWLNAKNAPRWDLAQSAIYMPYYNQTLVLIAAARAGELESFEEPDPTPPSMPSFR